VWKRDLPDASHEHEQPVPPEAPCVDKEEARALGTARPFSRCALPPVALAVGPARPLATPRARRRRRQVRESCAGWAKGGECDKNPGYMRGNCPKSCGACPPPKYDGPQATGYVRNAWEEEDEGGFIAWYTAKHVESHEARVLVVGFGPRAAAAAEARRAAAAAEATAAAGKRVPSLPSTRGAAASHAAAGHVEAGGQDGAEEAEEARGAPRVPQGSRMAAHTRQLEHADPVHQRARLDPALRAAHASEPHLKGVTLSACTYEYGASLLSLYIASAALTVMGVYAARPFLRGHGAAGKHATGGGRVRAHFDESPRR
jgi:hypothetical protein